MVVFKELAVLSEHFSKENLLQVKFSWKNPLVHAFYKANKTDFSFSNLKNELRDNRDENLAAEVLESAKDKYIVLLLHSRINKGDLVFFVTPLGEKIEFNIEVMKNFSGEEKNIVKKGEVCIINYLKGITSRSFLYKSSK